MDKNILVTYSSKYGATKEIASLSSPFKSNKLVKVVAKADDETPLRSGWTQQTDADAMDEIVGQTR